MHRAGQGEIAARARSLHLRSDEVHMAKTRANDVPPTGATPAEEAPSALRQELTPNLGQRDIRPRAGDFVEVKRRDKRMAWWFIGVIGALLAFAAWYSRTLP